MFLAPEREQQFTATLQAYPRAIQKLRDEYREAVESSFYLGPTETMDTVLELKPVNISRNDRLCEQRNQILNRPQPIRHTRSHRGSHPKILMNPNVVVVHVVNRQRRDVVLDLARERIR
jgi:hypothetical protein